VGMMSREGRGEEGDHRVCAPTSCTILRLHMMLSIFKLFVHFEGCVVWDQRRDAQPPVQSAVGTIAANAQEASNVGTD